MKREKFNALMRGDLIRHVTTGNSFVVVDSNGRGRVTIARTVDAMNPDEWERCPDLDDPRPGMSPASRPDPEAGLTMGEPESTPESRPVDFRYRANPDVGVIPAEVPADCLGAGVLHIPKRCAEVGEAGQVYRNTTEPGSQTTQTVSMTTTTSPAEPLARALLASPTCSASNDDVRRVALNLEKLAYRSRNRGAGEALAETTREAEEQVERQLTGNTTTSTTPDPKSSPFANARPLESFAEVAEALATNGVAVFPGNLKQRPVGDYSRSIGAWGEWTNGRPVIVDEVPVRPVIVNDGSFGCFFPADPVRPVFVNDDGRRVPISTPCRDCNDEPTIRLGRKALDELRGPFYASNRIPGGRESFFLNDIRQLPDGRLYEFRFVEHDPKFALGPIARLRDFRDPGALPMVPVATWRDARPVREFLFPSAVASVEPPSPYDWREVAVWNAALESWVDPFSFELVVNGGP